MPFYPDLLVQKLGIERLRVLSKVKVIRTPRPSKKRTAQEKITAFVEKHNRFSVAMCARSCVEKKDVVTSYLQKFPNLHVDPDGIYIKKGRCKDTKTTTKKIDRQPFSRENKNAAHNC